MKAILVAAALAALVPAAASAQKACSKADAANAEKAIERVVGWGQMQKAFKDFRQCDSGAVDDLYTDALLRLMVEWKNVDGFADAMKDPEFKQFAMKHLKSPAAQDDLESVYSRMKASCPPKHEALCAEFAEVVKKQPK